MSIDITRQQHREWSLLFVESGRTNTLVGYGLFFFFFPSAPSPSWSPDQIMLGGRICLSTFSVLAVKSGALIGCKSSTCRRLFVSGGLPTLFHAGNVRLCSVKYVCNLRTMTLTTSDPLADRRRGEFRILKKKKRDSGPAFASIDMDWSTDCPPTGPASSAVVCCAPCGRAWLSLLQRFRGSD